MVARFFDCLGFPLADRRLLCIPPVSVRLECRKALKNQGRTLGGAVLNNFGRRRAFLACDSSPKLIEVSGGGSPLLLGMFRPAIVVPAETRGG